MEMIIFNSLKVFRMALGLLSHQPLNPLVITIISSMNLGASTITIAMTMTMEQSLCVGLGE